MDKNKFLGLLILLISFFLLLNSSNTHGFKQEEIAARILTVSEDFKEAVINRGKVDNILPKTECIIRPNRGDGYAKIEWDIYFALGTVTQVDDTTAVVTITDLKDTIQPGDYCVWQSSGPSYENRYRQDHPF